MRLCTPQLVARSRSGRLGRVARPRGDDAVDRAVHDVAGEMLDGGGVAEVQWSAEKKVRESVHRRPARPFGIRAMLRGQAAGGDQVVEPSPGAGRRRRDGFRSAVAQVPIWSGVSTYRGVSPDISPLVRQQSRADSVADAVARVCAWPVM